jgi:3-oxoacyl-[acyl-carrier-protein] synthase II
VVLTRAVPVTALGENLESLWQALLAGQSGVAPLTRFDCRNFIPQQGCCIAGLQVGADGSRFEPLLERVAVQLGPLPAGCRLLVASTKGEIDRLENVGPKESVQSGALLFEALLAKIARRFDLADAGTNINAACASSTIALARAAGLIAAGQAAAVLIYAADILSKFIFSGFSALQALSPEASRPFDRQRQGLSLGEAGVALLLMSESSARAAGERILAGISGWGVANDAHHVTAPARDGCGLIRASRLALAKAGVDSGQIAAINAHGTGTLYNDAMELTAFNQIFGERLPPLHGVKGSLGHCLGAAGAVEIAIAARALQEQTIPGTCGCLDPEEAAQGRVMNSSQPISGDYLLCTNSGFGGINGAVILQRRGA